MKNIHVSCAVFAHQLAQLLIMGRNTYSRVTLMIQRERGREELICKIKSDKEANRVYAK